MTEYTKERERKDKMIIDYYMIHGQKWTSKHFRVSKDDIAACISRYIRRDK